MSDDGTKHPYGMDEVVAYHDGELSPDAAAAFEAHLAACEGCQRASRAADAALGALDDPYGEPPPLDMADVQAAFHRGEAQARAARRRRWFVGTAVGVGLSAAAAVTAAVLTSTHAPPEAPREETARPKAQRPPEQQAAPSLEHE